MSLMPSEPYFSYIMAREHFKFRLDVYYGNNDNDDVHFVLDQGARVAQ